MDNQLLQEVKAKATEWLNGNYDQTTKSIVKNLIDNDPKELIECFYKDLEFPLVCPVNHNPSQQPNHLYYNPILQLSPESVRNYVTILFQQHAYLFCIAAVLPPTNSVDNYHLQE